MSHTRAPTRDSQPIKVVVARAQREAQAGAAGLRSLGFDATHFGGLQVTPSLTEGQRAELIAQRPTPRAIMYVSANAVEALWGTNFVENSPLVSGSIESVAINFESTHSQPVHWATGPSTAAALAKIGVAESNLACPSGQRPQFDSEALWAVVEPQVQAWPRPASVWIIRGRDADGQVGRPWLAQQLLAAGVDVTTHVVYERRLVPMSQEACDLARASFARGDAWIFANGQVLSHLMDCVVFTPSQLANVRVLTTHPSIASLARDWGLVRVDQGDAGHSAVEWAQSLQLSDD